MSPIVVPQTGLTGAFQYAAVVDVRAFGVPSSVTDSLVSDSLDLATQIINNYTSTIFGLPASMTYVAYDVRNGLVTLPTPFTNVSSVSVGTHVVDSSAYSVQAAWGLRLKTTAGRDGFSPSAFIYNGRYDYSTAPVDVSVIAMYGYPIVPLPVKRAAVMLASRLATKTFRDAVLDQRITGLAVEGYEIQMKSTLVPNLYTTGDLEVDRLLQPYRQPESMLA